MRQTAIVLPLALLVQLSAMSALLAMSTPPARANEAHDGVVLLHANALFNRDTTARRASLSRLPGHIAFWFAWSGFLREDGELATAEN